MSITTVKNAAATITNITGEDLDWLRECMEIQADELAHDADYMAREAQQASANELANAAEYEEKANVKREEAERTACLAALLATATQVDIKSEVAE